MQGAGAGAGETDTGGWGPKIHPKADSGFWGSGTLPRVSPLRGPFWLGLYSPPAPPLPLGWKRSGKGGLDLTIHSPPRLGGRGHHHTGIHTFK